MICLQQRAVQVGYHHFYFCHLKKIIEIILDNQWVKNFGQEKLKFPKTNSLSECLSDASLRQAASKQRAEKIILPAEWLKLQFLKKV
jgi:hypothetical protein